MPRSQPPLPVTLTLVERHHHCLKVLQTEHSHIPAQLLRSLCTVAEFHRTEEEKKEFSDTFRQKSAESSMHTYLNVTSLALKTTPS